MKGSPKTWIIGLAALGAAAFLAWHFYALHRSRAAAGNNAGHPSAVLTNSVAAGTNDLALPALGLDRAYAGEHWTGWLESPKRDPFLLIKPVAPPQRTNHFVHFTLKAVWRQDGASLAAINDGIYRPGDALEEFRVESIDDHGVWLEVNGHKEFVDFSAPEPEPEFGPEPHPGFESRPEPRPEPESNPDAQAALNALGALVPGSTNLVHSAQTALEAEKAALDSANDALRAANSTHN